MKDAGGKKAAIIRKVKRLWSEGTGLYYVAH